MLQLLLSVLQDGRTGYLNADHIQEYMPSATDQGSMVFVCGPTPMVAAVAGPTTKDYKQGECAGLLGAAGYTAKQVLKF